MSKVRVRFITLIALVALFAASLIFALCFSLVGVSAAEVTYSVTTVFSPDVGGTISASTIETEGEKSYMQFTLLNDGSVYFPRNLALKWYTAVKDPTKPDEEVEDEGEDKPEGAALEAGERANPGKVNYFSMVFSFSNTTFDRLLLDFESAEENITKEGKATNTIIFKKEEGVIYVAIVNADEQENKDKEKDDNIDYYVALSTAENEDYKGDIKIALSEAENGGAGEFVVTISYNGGEALELGTHNLFTNVGGYYLEYRSSGTTPNTPMTFTAEVPEAESGEANKLVLLMKELNGQHFELNDSGRVVDDAPAALVLNEKVYAFTLGKRFSLSPVACDVCVDTPSVTRSFYMLKKDKVVEDDDEEKEYYHKADETKDDDYTQLRTTYYFVPTEDGEEEQYVSIRFRLDDRRGSAEYAYSYLTWYAADGAVAMKGDEGKDNYFDYILVNRVQKGPKYTDITVDDAEKKNTVNEASRARANYQADVTAEAAKKTTSAGDGAYFYLPSLRDLITSEVADYRNLRFTISYYKPDQAMNSTANNESSLRYNALRFEINRKGKYVFKVFATDANGQAMRMYLDGNLVSVTAENVWDIDEIPTFEFTAKYTGATIEKPTSQSVGYLDSTYTISSFEIIALAGYSAEYTLYRLDASKLPDGETLPGYDALWKDADTYFNRYYKENAEDSALIKINAYNSDIDEDDAAWSRTDNDYEWYPDSSTKTFRPQESTYYFVKLEVTDAAFEGFTATAYQVIDVQNPRDTVAGRSDWLENNVTSVVLFSISAVLAIAIVVLFVVKPSDKKVEEVDLNTLKGNKDEKKKK